MKVAKLTKLPNSENSIQKAHNESMKAQTRNQVQRAVLNLQLRVAI